jgi:eukaryotic-like serine/threonine-protein kinase
MPDTGALLNQSLAGRYHVERELGRGGMAVVFLARDLRHDRTVAIKVLHADLAAAIGVERFLAEIRVTARLQHPNILPLLDSGLVGNATSDVSGGGQGALPFYVSPYVAGGSLRERLERERQLPIGDALRITSGVAAALAYAHNQGVIHRDIKPENVLLQEGEPVVADFGIALAVSAAAGERLTQTGLSLGTPAYMSPEQAMGERQLDGRTDIYALGAVLYEMLAGEPPFVGPTAQAIVARVLTEKPRSVAIARDTVPSHVDAAVTRALQKLPADRFPSAAAFAAAIATDVGGVATSAVFTNVSRSGGGARRRSWTVALPWALAVAATGVASWLFVRRTTDAQTERWAVGAPGDVRIVDGAGRGNGRLSPPAVSNDGTTLAYVGTTDSTRRLYVGRLGSGDPVVLPETEGARAPFFSDDGKSIGFFANDEIRKVDLTTQRVTVIKSGVDALAGAWTDGKKIAFLDVNGFAWIPENGGAVHRLPVSPLTPYLSVLPRDRIVVGDLDARICVISLVDGSVHYLVPGGDTRIAPPPLTESLVGVWGRYVAPHFLTFWRPGAISYAVRFDEATLRVTGEPVEIMRGIRVFAAGVSPAGVLAHEPEPSPTDDIAELGPSGVVRVLPVQPERYLHLALSRDGGRVAMRVMTASGSSQVVVHDLTRPGAPIVDRIPAGLGRSIVWERSGRFIYADSMGGIVYRRDLRTGVLDSAVVPKAVDELFQLQDVIGGDTLIVDIGKNGERVVYLIPFREPGRRIELIKRAKDQSAWELSPDGRWLLYGTRNGDNVDQYLAPVGSPNEAVRLEDVDGAFRWGSDNQLYFFRGDSLLRAPVIAGPNGPELRARSASFVALSTLIDGGAEAYAPLGKGQSVLGLVARPAPAIHHLTVVLRWDQELDRRVR